MAHFAELDENNVVTAIHVVANDAINAENEEESGIEFLRNWSGTQAIYKQCSYNGNFRKQYPAIGYRYDENFDAFIEPKPYSSWSLDDYGNWISPIAKPDGDSWIWSEEEQEWINVEESVA